MRMSLSQQQKNSWPLGNLGRGLLWEQSSKKKWGSRGRLSKTNFSEEELLPDCNDPTLSWSWEGQSQEEAAQCSQFWAWTEVKSWQSDFLHSKVVLHTSTLSEGAEQNKKKKWASIQKTSVWPSRLPPAKALCIPRLASGSGPCSPPVTGKGSPSALGPPEKPLPVKNHKRNYWECLRPEKSKTWAASAQKSASSTVKPWFSHLFGARRKRHQITWVSWRGVYKWKCRTLKRNC